MTTPVLLTLLLAMAPQQAPRASGVDAYVDEGARVLVNAARDRWKNVDQSLLGYSAVLRERIAVGLRAFRRDRTLFRQEQASRVQWFRDDESVVQVIAARQQHPGGVEVPKRDEMLSGDLFDPSDDPLLFGIDSDDDEPADVEFRVRHPLETGSERFYRFRTGDTLRIALPDRELMAVEVEVLPRERAIDRITGSLWIDPESGGLVRAAYRLARAIDVERDWESFSDDDPDVDEARTRVSRIPGILKPMRIEIRIVVVEYSLWEFEYWLPRTLRAEGEARAGIVRVPASFEISYEILDAWGEDGLAERRAKGEPTTSSEVVAAWDPDYEHNRHFERQEGRSVEILVPGDVERLLTSRELPPPIWEDISPAISAGELEEMFSEIADLPEARLRSSPWMFAWGYQGSGLLRYNRVEGLSVGARMLRYFGPFEGSFTAHAALAAPTLDATVELRRARPRGQQSLTVYRTLRSVDSRGLALGLGNSSSALLLGRDDGEYFRATGAAFAWMPPTTDREWYKGRLYVERHEPVGVHTDVALPGLWDSSVFRPNIVADRAVQVGAALRLTPWWGSDRSKLQGGLDWFVQGEVGDFDHARSQLTASLVAPLGERLRTGLEVAGGSGLGDVPAQRRWYVGGGSTLRGYPGSTLTGTSYLRGRLEVSHGTQAFGLALFSDWAWAGERTSFDAGEGLYSLGLGATTLDGIIRVDLARGLRSPTGWRLDLRVDGLL